MSDEPAVKHGGSAKIRVHATPAECAEIVRLLSDALDVADVSRQYPDRAPSQLVRVYVEVRL